MKTDCNTKTGIMVGLVDSLISISRVLAPRLRAIHDDLRWPEEIKEALSDLYEDKDVLYVLTFKTSESPYIGDRKESYEIIRKAVEGIQKSGKPIIV